ncbi:MAG: A/G-specific adenine glycosylase [Bacteroidales bacterium]
MMNIAIKTVLLNWYADNKRDLPWRRTKDPYSIWVSEIILQQTRVVYGMEYFRRFMECFPTVTALARAREDEVMRIWQGLGYYRRAAYMHLAAKVIAEHYNGIFPNTYARVGALPGVGSYTAAAICSIAYNLPYAVVDGNVYRILARLFAIELPIDSIAGKRYFAELADSLLDKENAGDYNQAIMDFGAMQCVPQSPQCRVCPFAGRCAAFLHNKVDVYPVKKKKTEVKNRYFNYLRISCGSKILLRKRTERDIWQNLYEFPMIESPHQMDYDALATTAEFCRLTKGATRIELKKKVPMAKHQLSHQTIYAVFYELETDNLPQPQGTIAVEECNLQDYAKSRLIENYLNSL